MIEFYPPVNMAEWIETICAAVTIVVGSAILLVPRALMRLGGGSPDISAIVVLRGHLGGLILGLGLAALLLQQPLLYLALGISWGGSVIGQLVSFVVERQLSTAKIFILVSKSALAVLPILAVLGFFG